MTMHRPHPIDGPWPYRIDPDAGIQEGDPVPLTARHPVLGSAIYADPEGAVLYDGCDRCEQQAVEPLALDIDTLETLWHRMLQVEGPHDPHGTEGYRTAAEAHAGRWLYRIAVLIERTHPWIDPWTWPWDLGRSGDDTVQVLVRDLPWRPDSKDRKDNGGADR